MAIFNSYVSLPEGRVLKHGHVMVPKVLACWVSIPGSGRFVLKANKDSADHCLQHKPKSKWSNWKSKTLGTGTFTCWRNTIFPGLQGCFNMYQAVFRLLSHMVLYISYIGVGHSKRPLWSVFFFKNKNIGHRNLDIFMECHSFKDTRLYHQFLVL